MISGPISLLIIQGTPFCNIDCKYCYLPDRTNKNRLSISTFKQIITRIFESDLVRQDFTIVWHAGEPLVMPLQFYQEATNIIKEYNTSRFKVKQNFQTNGILLTEEWCEFLKENTNVQISLSIDGPEHIHNFQRVNRKGDGTFASVMRAVNLLKSHEITFSVISVITDYTLNFADEYYDFFKELNPVVLGANVEEIENNNFSSSLYSKNTTMDRYKEFLSNLYNLYVRDDRSLRIREFQQIENFILRSNVFKNRLGQQTTPYRIVSVDLHGNYSTLSPELLSMKSIHYGDFIFGNVFNLSFADALKTEKFNRLYNDVLTGMVNCKNSCKYYNVCGGGVPSNKYSEKQSFMVTETNHCKFKYQAPFEIILKKLEEEMSHIH